MEKAFGVLLQYWKDLALAGGLVILTLLATLAVRRYFFQALARWTASTATSLDNLLVDTLRLPFLLWGLILGVHLAVQTSALPDRFTAQAGKVLLILWVASLTMVAANLATGAIRHYGQRLAGTLTVTTLTQNLARAFIASVGLLVILNLLGISIAPILAALGVGGLAVALALQDTLANLFAGFYVMLAGQVRVGDYVKLAGGEEGYVTDIGWRSTTIRALANNLIIVPNAELAKAIVTNYYLPEKRMSLLVPVGVSYDCDPDHVERVLIEEALAGAEEIPGLLREPAPFVRFIPGFGDSSLGFTLICQVAEFTDQYLVQHELRKRILKRFRKEGIEIPFPVRTLRVKRDQAFEG